MPEDARPPAQDPRGKNVVYNKETNTWHFVQPGVDSPLYSNKDLSEVVEWATRQGLQPDIPSIQDLVDAMKVADRMAAGQGEIAESTVTASASMSTSNTYEVTIEKLPDGSYQVRNLGSKFGPRFGTLFEALGHVDAQENWTLSDLPDDIQDELDVASQQAAEAMSTGGRFGPDAERSFTVDFEDGAYRIREIGEDFVTISPNVEDVLAFMDEGADNPNWTFHMSEEVVDHIDAHRAVNQPPIEPSNPGMNDWDAEGDIDPPDGPDDDLGAGAAGDNPPKNPDGAGTGSGLSLPTEAPPAADQNHPPPGGNPRDYPPDPPAYDQATDAARRWAGALPYAEQGDEISMNIMEEQERILERTNPYEMGRYRTLRAMDVSPAEAMTIVGEGTDLPVLSSVNEYRHAQQMAQWTNREDIGATTSRYEAYAEALGQTGPASSEPAAVRAGELAMRNFPSANDAVERPGRSKRKSSSDAPRKSAGKRLGPK